MNNHEVSGSQNNHKEFMTSRAINATISKEKLNTIMHTNNQLSPCRSSASQRENKERLNAIQHFKIEQ